MNEHRMYRMTAEQRQRYILLLVTEREKEALAFREACDAYWTAHLDEWERVKLTDVAPMLM